MATVLHIAAHPNPEHSQTTAIARALLARYQAAHPDDTIQELCLYQEPVPYLTSTHIAAMVKPDPAQLTSAEIQARREIQSVVEHFTAADKYIVSTPMWNFSVPGILKSYLDFIVQAGLTFRYTEVGTSEGLLTGRRMILVGTRGGIYSVPPLSQVEHCFTYLHSAFEFLGIDVIGSVIAEGLALVGAEAQHDIMHRVTEDGYALVDAL